MAAELVEVGYVQPVGVGSIVCAKQTAEGRQVRVNTGFIGDIVKIRKHLYRRPLAGTGKGAGDIARFTRTFFPN